MKQKLLKSTMAIIFSTILIKMAGFFREIALAYVYGAGTVTDAFVIAYTIPSMLLSVVSGSVASIFIPQYQKSGENKYHFTSNIINLFIILGLFFSLIFTFIPQSLVFLFASQLDPDTFTLATELVRIIAWTAIPVLLANIYRSWLEMRGAFFTASVSALLINTCTIVFIVLSHSVHSLSLLAVGVAVGNLLYLMILVLSSGRLGFKYCFYLNIHDSNIKEMLIMLAPVFVSTIIGDINQIIDRNFASSLASGSVSSLNYASKVVGLITALMGSALATVLFPRMSALAADGEYTYLKKYLSGCINKLIPLILPIMTGIIILAKPFVRIMFERGAFSPEDTQRTAECLQMYAICIFANNMNPLIIKAYYSVRNTKTPAMISAAAVAVNVILNILLIGPMRHRGLAFATGVASVISFLLLMLSMRKKIGELGIFSNNTELLKTVLATGIMGEAVWAGYWILPIMSGSYLQCVVLTACLVFAAAILYFSMHAIYRSEFLSDSIKQIMELGIFTSQKKRGL